MSMPTPGEVTIRQLSVNGTDLSPYVYELSIYESLFKPFRAAEVTITDTNNVMKSLDIKGNEDVEMSIECAGEIYTAKFKVLSPENGNSSNNLRIQGVKLNLVSEIFLKNKTTTVQKSFKNITGSDAVKKIFDELGVKGNLDASSSKGMIGENEPYIVSNLNPFEAIHGIRTRITGDKYKTGAYCFFEDKEGNYIFKQLEELFDNMSPVAKFTHKSTQGGNIKDMEGQSYNIIGFQEKTSFSPGGRFDIGDVMNTRKSAQVSTYSTSESKFNKGQVKDPAEGKKGGEFKVNDNYGSSGKPRSTTVIPHDKRLEKNSVQAEKSAEEQRYVQEVKNGPQCTIQVLMDSGIKCTVGKAVSADISQPIGDMTNAQSGNPIGGDMLVINLRHHIKMYNAKPKATTILELAKGGYNKGT